MEITTELMNTKYKIRQLELQDHDTEQLSIDFQKLKEENRRLKKENQALRTKKPKTVETDGNVIRFPPPDKG